MMVYRYSVQPPQQVLTEQVRPRTGTPFSKQLALPHSDGRGQQHHLGTPAPRLQQRLQPPFRGQAVPHSEHHILVVEVEGTRLPIVLLRPLDCSCLVRAPSGRNGVRHASFCWCGLSCCSCSCCCRRGSGGAYNGQDAAPSFSGAGRPGRCCGIVVAAVEFVDKSSRRGGLLLLSAAGEVKQHIDRNDLGQCQACQH